MDYAKIYNQLIENAKNRDVSEGYVERHHIVPRSLGGSNKKENLINLTGREHFVAHLLLHKMHLDHIGMAIAILRMRFDGRRVQNSKKYEWIRKSTSKILSEYQRKHAKEIQNRPEVKEKHRVNSRKMWENPEFRKHMIECNLGSKNPNFGKTMDNDTRNKHARACGGTPFKVWKSICIRPSSPKLGIGNYAKGEFIGEFTNMMEFERDFGVWTTLINKCLKGKAPQARGYIFEKS